MTSDDSDRSPPDEEVLHRTRLLHHWGALGPGDRGRSPLLVEGQPWGVLEDAIGREQWRADVDR